MESNSSAELKGLMEVLRATVNTRKSKNYEVLLIAEEVSWTFSKSNASGEELVICISL